jgi:hypothetical protein
MVDNTTKIAVVILASTETHEGLGRAVNGLMTAKEALENGGEAEVVFDGAGVVAAAALADPGHKAHGVYDQVRNNFTGVCAICARSFGVEDATKELGIPFLTEYKQHPSLYGRMAAGTHVVTF